MARARTHLLIDKHCEIINVLNVMRITSDWEGIVDKGVTEKLPDSVNVKNVVGSCYIAVNADVTLSCR